MSQMIAKFPGRCRACGQYINVGDRIEWSKGDGARHVECPPAAGAKPLRRAQAAAPGADVAPYVLHEKWEPMRRPAFEAQVAAQAGRVVLADKPRMVLSREGREPVAADGSAYVVVSGTGRYETTEQNEDMGDMTGPGWQVTLYLRRATDEEAAPARAAAAKAQAAREPRAVEIMRELLGG